MNAVATNFARLCHMDEKQIQLFERLGHARQKSVSLPSLCRRCFRLSGFAAMVHVQKKRTQAHVKLSQCERRFTAHTATAGRCIPIQLAEKHLIHGQRIVRSGHALWAFPPSKRPVGFLDPR